MRSKLPARLLVSAQRAHLTIADDNLEQLATYVELLSKWNERVNLTSLALNPLTDEALDRLITEPLAALKYLPKQAGSWFDLGSGGGSPALPLKVMAPWLQLTMVEARMRKAAFLREAVRILKLSDVVVENRRAEELTADFGSSASLVTVRALSVDLASKAATALLADGGCLLLFRSDSDSPQLKAFQHLQTVQLLEDSRSYLAEYARLFHVEQSD